MHDRTTPRVVDVHWQRTDMLRSASEIGDALALLSADERARFERFRHAEDRRDYALAHALLRRALSARGPLDPDAWRFAAPDGQPPALLNGSLAFSLSHTRGLVASVVSEQGRLGIDVEGVRAVDVHGVTRHYFSDAERDTLDGLAGEPQVFRFLDMWTLKEAFAKATGAGLTVALRNAAFAFEDRRIAAVLPDGSCCRFVLFGIDDRYRMAVAANATPDEPTIMVRQSRNRHPGLTLIAASPGMVVE